jgi:hypothetical protein
VGDEPSAALAWIEHAGNPLPALAAAALLITAAASLGALATAHRRSPCSLLVNIAVGLTLLGWLAALFGPPGLLTNGRSLWLLVSVIAVSGLVRFRRGRLSRALSAAGPGPAKVTSRIPASPFLFATTLLLFTLGPALVLPDGWDELVYHVELPRRWLESGAPLVESDLPYSAFPSLPELLFWTVAPVDLHLAPRLVNWVAWAIAIALLFAICRERLRLWPAMFVTLTFAFSPAVLMVSANCYVEAFLLMQLAALLAMSTEVFDGDERRPLIMGLLCGGAVAVKLTGVVALAFPLLSARFGSGKSSGLFRRSALPMLIALAIAFPFYLRPLMATGNPFYPYLDRFLTVDPERRAMSAFHHSVADFFGLHTLTGFFTGPILLAFNDLLYDGAFGWQFVGLPGLAAVGIAFARRDDERRLAPIAALCAAGMYAAWFFTAQQARFATPAALALTVVAARGLSQFRARWRHVVVAALVGATIVSLPVRNAGYYFGSWETLAGYWTRLENLDDGTRGQYLPLVEAIERSTPQGAKLLLLFEHRGLYLRRAREIGTPGFRAGGVPRGCETDPDLFHNWLKQKGVTHVVLANRPQGPDQNPEWRTSVEYVYRAVEKAVDARILTVVWQSQTHVLLGVSE